MIENFIDSALIIDDKEEEIKTLKSLLEKKDIWVKHFHPQKLKSIKLKNRKIIFLDLMLDENKSEKDNISTIIRPMLTKNMGKNYGTYGIVLWTRHIEWQTELKNKIQNDKDKYTLPLFIVGMDKSKYLQSGNFDSIFSDLNGILNSDIAANFFILWSILVNQGRDKAIHNIYSLINGYENQERNLQYILFRMAQNYTGIPVSNLKDYPLHIDAYKSFNDMLVDEVVSAKNNNSDIFKNFSEISFIAKNKDYSKNILSNFFYQNNEINGETKNSHESEIGKLKKELDLIFAKINFKVLLSDKNLEHNKILPGNIYEVKSKNSPFYNEDLSTESKQIVIEMTPPCDFSNNKTKDSKVLGGFITKYSKNKYKEHKKENYYEYIWPINIDGFENPSMIIFDFKYFGSITKSDLSNKRKFKIILRANEKVFADILQKLSSYLSRLGLAIIQ